MFKNKTKIKNKPFKFISYKIYSKINDNILDNIFYNK